MAEYYNTLPDGVIDDRFGIRHSDYTSPEYQTLDKISPTKWEECRGLGRSFGYNRAEGEAETISSDELIDLLVDVVSKNGNLLLDVGPEADGTIPPVQMERLQALGAWLQQNGEAIYGTHPWKRAVGETIEGIGVRFTRKDSVVYATLLGQPKTKTITIKALSPEEGSQIYLLGGDGKALVWSRQGDGIQVSLHGTAPLRHAYVLRMTGPVS
jgi:alpha-L-fucosidase